MIQCSKVQKAAATAGETLDDLLLSSQPEVPAPGKWTKLGSILTFLIVGFNVCHGISRTFKASLDKIHLKCETTGKEGNDEDTDPALTSELSFAAVNGKRARNGVTLTSNGLVQFSVLLLGIMQEVTHFMTSWHLKAGSRQNRQVVSRPPLLDVVNPKFSPYVMVLQYLASMLISPVAGRILLLCPSYLKMEEWEKVEKHEVRTFRRICMYLSGWIFRRHMGYVSEPPISTCVSWLKASKNVVWQSVSEGSDI